MRTNKRKIKSVIDMKFKEARKFFLKGKSYCNFDLPPYFTFDGLIKKIDKELEGKTIKSYMANKGNPRNHDDINHVILNNKDGQYAWRPLQLIHPVIYVALVQSITKEENWNLILKRFQEFSENESITCCSLPIKSSDKDSDQKKQILNWFDNVEQKSIALSLEYDYLVQMDITDCYSAIYTHSIAWALHGKEEAKHDRGNKNLIGNIIDNYIQDMSHGQTNGIPQGSALMDFIAEIVLGYADLELSKKIKESSITGYRMLRYRDDYRIFTNSQQEAKAITKYLSEVLAGLGLKINSNKTDFSDNIVSSSIKKDKLYWICQKQDDACFQKHLLIIHELGMKYINSGSLVKALNQYYERINKLQKFNQYTNLMPIISILVDIAFRNPRTYPIISAILSQFMRFVGEDEKEKIVCKIINRFKKIPNTEYLEIWLQRITIPINSSVNYENKLCKLVAGNQSVKAWNSVWLNDGSKLSDVIKSISIIDEGSVSELPAVIELKEVSQFFNLYD